MQIAAESFKPCGGKHLKFAKILYRYLPRHQANLAIFVMDCPTHYCNTLIEKRLCARCPHINAFQRLRTLLPNLDKFFSRKKTNELKTTWRFWTEHRDIGVRKVFGETHRTVHPATRLLNVSNGIHREAVGAGTEFHTMNSTSYKEVKAGIVLHKNKFSLNAFCQDILLIGAFRIVLRDVVHFHSLRLRPKKTFPHPQRHLNCCVCWTDGVTRFRSA